MIIQPLICLRRILYFKIYYNMKFFNRKNMKKYFVFYPGIIFLIIIGCSSDNQLKNSLPCIDVRKNYPEKEIILTDIADIHYIHLSTEYDNYLYQGVINYVTENTIVVFDLSSGSILFFAKDGKPKSRFNNSGSGPEEYFFNRFNSVIFDEAADDVFVSTVPSNIFQVYSSVGEYKRKITLPQGTGVGSIIDYDDQSFFIYDLQNEFKKKSEEESTYQPQSLDSSYFRISKINGKVLEYITFPGNEIDLSVQFSVDGGWIRKMPPHRRIVKCATGLFLCHIDTDTVYFYGKDKSLIPILCKIPLASDIEPKLVLNNYFETDQYQFMQIIPLSWENSLTEKCYLRDKKTGKIFRQKIILPDYSGKEFSIAGYYMQYHNNVYQAVFEMDLIELKAAYEENRLGGKLKDLVATLNEYEDNNVFMFVSFKQN